MNGVFIVSGIYIFSLILSVFQERIVTQSYDGDRFEFPLALNLIATSICACVAFATARITQLPNEKVVLPPKRGFFAVAVLNALGSPIGHLALRFIDFPFLVLASACKLVPIMAFGMLRGREYGVKHAISAAAMAAGVATYANAFANGVESSSDYNNMNVVIGLALIALNLIVDALMSNGQEHLYARYTVPPFLMMAGLSTCSAILFGGAMLVEPLFLGLKASSIYTLPVFVAAHPEIILHLLMYGFSAAMVQLFVYQCISRYGSFVTTAITISRKLLSFGLSFLIFQHPVHIHQLLGMAFVFVGLVLQVGRQHTPKAQRKSSLASLPSVSPMKKVLEIPSTPAVGAENPLVTSPSQLVAGDEKARRAALVTSPSQLTPVPEKAGVTAPESDTTESEGDFEPSLGAYEVEDDDSGFTSTSSSDREDIQLQQLRQRRRARTVSLSCVLSSPANAPTRRLSSRLLDRSWEAILKEK